MSQLIVEPLERILYGKEKAAWVRSNNRSNEGYRYINNNRTFLINGQHIMNLVPYWGKKNKELIFEDEILRNSLLLPIQKKGSFYFMDALLLETIGIDSSKWPEKIFMGSDNCIRMPRDFPFFKDRDFFNGLAARLSFEDGVRMYNRS